MEKKNGLHIDKRGTKAWHQNGELHRENGPAVIYDDGMVLWWLHDKRLGEGVEGFWKLWELLTPDQRNNLNLLKWLAKYSGYEVDTRDTISPE